MLLDPPNFLVLDEPTNHLDLATKEMLVDSLKDFEGTMLFVSHDRTFLRGLSNRVLELGGEIGRRPAAARVSGLVHRVCCSGPAMRLQGFIAKVACLYDIHGNLPALEAVLADVRETRVDRMVIGGDVLPGPMPRQCLDLLLSLDIPCSFIIGNGDRETAAAARGPVSDIIPEYFRQTMRWNAAELRPRDLEIIDGWPLTTRLTMDGTGEVLFCHATPRNDTEIFTSATKEAKLLPIFDALDVKVVVCGHVHMQFDRMVGQTRVINAGSVGMPFQDPGAYWLLIDNGIELRRTDYDLEAAADRVRGTRYPQAEEFASKNVLTTPDMAAMIAAFSRAELN